MQAVPIDKMRTIEKTKEGHYILSEWRDFNWERWKFKTVEDMGVFIIKKYGGEYE
jgi:hypothetical protein